MRLLFLVAIVFCAGTVRSQPNRYTFVFLHKKTDAVPLTKEKLDALMQGHLANIERLAKEGKIIAAGPFEGGGGIFVLNTASTAEAEAWLSTDPGILAERWNIEILPYTPRIGSVCAAQEPYEMVTYQFIHFKANVTKATIRDYPKVFYAHDEYLQQLEKTGNVVTEAIFGDFDGGILVLQGSVEKDVIESDPAVQAGLLTAEFKQLWIAKGSFCEP